MNNKILIKISNKNIKKELKLINFSAEYIDTAEKKFKFLSFKIFNLSPAEANILKQTCLSLGFDAAINRDAVTCKCAKSDAIITCSISQIEKLCFKLQMQPFRLKELAELLKKNLNREEFYFIKDKEFSFNKTYIMGILNVTPDSFSDGGKNFHTDTAVKSALRMYDEGAAIIDVGGESTRPNSEPVSPQTECDRILPVIKKIKNLQPKILISVDTIHPETIVKSIEAGADILNTVDCIEKFEPVLDFLKKHKTPIVITHSDGIPPKHVERDFEGDIVEEIFKFFTQKITWLKSKGLTENLFILDVGIGFGKSINDQFEIIKRADEFSTLCYPILFGISRKSFISNTFGIENRDEITKIYAQHLMSKKVNMLRVHDVKAHFDLQKYIYKIT